VDVFFQIKSYIRSVMKGRQPHALQRIWIRTTAVVLLLCTLGQPFHQSLITTAFHLNRAFIAENFCVNSDKPELGCFGICQLKKNLAENEENKQKELLDFVQQASTFQLPYINIDLPMIPSWAHIQTLFPHRTENLPTSPFSKLLKPPVA